MQYAMTIPDTSASRRQLRPGQRQLLRRFEQASVRAERHRVGYEAATAARAQLAAQLLAAGLSERVLAGLLGVSRARVRALATDAAVRSAVASVLCRQCGLTRSAGRHTDPVTAAVAGNGTAGEWHVFDDGGPAS